MGARGTAEWARLRGDKNLICELVDSDAVGIGAGCHIDEPLARPGIDHAHDRPVGHVAPSGVVAVVAGVVPDFVGTAGLIHLDLAGDPGSASRSATLKY